MCNAPLCWYSVRTKASLDLEPLTKASLPSPLFKIPCWYRKVPGSSSLYPQICGILVKIVIIVALLMILLMIMSKTLNCCAESCPHSSITWNLYTLIVRIRWSPPIVLFFYSPEHPSSKAHCTPWRINWHTRASEQRQVLSIEDIKCKVRRDQSSWCCIELKQSNVNTQSAAHTKQTQGYHYKLAFPAS